MPVQDLFSSCWVTCSVGCLKGEPLLRLGNPLFGNRVSVRFQRKNFQGTAFELVVGRHIVHVMPFVQFPDALVVGDIRANLADEHQFVSRNGNRIFKTVFVPQLKNGHVKADVGGIQC